jgi:hypothetical protein
VPAGIADNSLTIKAEMAAESADSRGAASERIGRSGAACCAFGAEISAYHRAAGYNNQTEFAPIAAYSRSATAPAKSVASTSPVIPGSAWILPCADGILVAGDDEI